MNRFKFSLKYGAIAGAIMMLSWVVTQVIMGDGSNKDYSQLEVLGYISMALALSTVFVGVKNHRDKHLGGVITFKQAFMTGFWIVLVASVIYVIGWMIYYPNFMADFPEQYSAYQLEQYRAEGMSEADLAVKQEEMTQWVEMYKNPLVMMAFTFLEIFPIGLVVALLSAVILKRKG
ncbi:DUF4199 domain-containing protein [Marinoscillum furvescens]|uniref:Uncharacterized protein DUF4199 n=1 Tax=Marinoscillum furvescens DSM 4134 TaxID=1122208 RepID=A0A3D9L2A7_MARFU|nr:DUF4199 domain-containing protein [Marinoscillum furvescens]RED96575.1 uncharacterized protein DUF4199 [Marinoscillum furvescens DSM 4134]